MRLFLIRHGAVAPPRPGMFYGGSEVPLSDLGQEEARRAAAALRAEELDRVLASPLSRARFGADCLLQDRPQMACQVVDGFREIDRGRWVGLTKEELDAQYPDDLASHARDPESWDAHGGESLGSFRDRVVGTWAALEADLLELEAQEARGLQVAVVSHLFPTRAILAHYRRVELAGWDEFKIPTASISELEVRAAGKAEVLRVGWKPEA
jgi:broad specificity phosphatase PhoE